MFDSHRSICKPSMPTPWPLGSSFPSLHQTMAPHDNFIASHNVASVLAEVKEQPSELVDLSLDSTVEEAFDVLLANDILSVPVYRVEDETKVYVAIVGVLDLLKFTTIQPAIDNLNTQSQVLPDFGTLYDRSQFLLRPLKDVIGLTPESAQLFIVHPSDPLSELLRLFTSRRVHRVLVVDDGAHTPREMLSHRAIDLTKFNAAKRISHPVLLSQTDVVRFLWRHNHHLGKILDTPAGGIANRSRRLFPSSTLLNPEPENTVIVTIHQTALQAFSHISSTDVQAVVVVDDDGEVVGEISAGDLRGLNRNRVMDLVRPVIMFLRNTQGQLFRPLMCHARFTLSQCVSALVKGEAHRVWMVDEEERPIGVVTLSDVLSVFVPATEE
ncbi:hypothetical protein BC936DRAFT_140836 [Jimgerdemannia flammicorona]|uniref:CBS domain-containing protein n=1 Tax=Jimgerdemannia flammicorona TaxID=994334 RepID=A0A433A3C8_9FUNG|nr:hypothetical protein BC936DRAFT_140836 [Jimgerdemannia flammicorona]